MKELLNFLETSYTAYQATENARACLLQNGFTELSVLPPFPPHEVNIEAALPPPIALKAPAMAVLFRNERLLIPFLFINTSLKSAIYY